MDLASLISHPGPDPLAAVKSRGVYSPPEHPSSYKPAESYFSMPASYQRTPQPPLSPPAEEQQPKCSLPSISTLIESADSAPVHPAKRQKTSPSSAQEIDPRIQSQTYEPSRLPPTPPLRPGSGFHSTTHSPSTSSASAELKNQDRVTLPSPMDNRASVSSQGSTQQHPTAGSYASPAPSVASYSSPVELPPSSAPAMYYQRPAPAPAAAAPAPAPATAQAPPVPHGIPQMVPQLATPTPTWQHHHYFPSSSTAPYQQNHDRYICRTCHKAFSRPSSLRIHSHSHTGEKPFRCTHAGCGKAFSVRSNMKRHERGCHSARAVTAAVV